MKIRLIQPAHYDAQGKPTRFEKLWFPNLTLPTVAALTPAGVDVAITTEYIQDIDFDEKVDLVGITAQTCQAPRAYDIADEFRKRGTRVVMGGIHASACPEEAIRHVDAVVVGEAEHIWPVVVADARHGVLKRLYKNDQKPDLSEPAVPRYDLVDYKDYMIPPFAKTPLIQIQAARGCPHGCDFCTVSQFFGRRIRKKPLTNVIREIEKLEPSRVFFTDDNIIADPSYARELFAALKPMKLRWACQMSTNILKHPELIKAAADAGCHETFTGLESLSEDNLASVHKGFTSTVEYREFLRRLADVGILPQVSVITGLDHDTHSSLIQMAETLAGWEINYIYITTITPYPGTVMRDRLAAEGRILTSDWSKYDLLSVVVKPRLMTIAEQQDALWRMYEIFYSRGSNFRRFCRFGRQYLQYFPRDNFFEELFFHIHVRHAVKKRMHPFSMGSSAEDK